VRSAHASEGMTGRRNFPSNLVERTPGRCRTASSIGEIVRHQRHRNPDFSPRGGRRYTERRPDDLLRLDSCGLRGSGPAKEARSSNAKPTLAALTRRANTFIQPLAHAQGSGPDISMPPASAVSRGHCLKKSDSTYRSGQTETWVKTRSDGPHEVVIGGWKMSGNWNASLVDQSERMRRQAAVHRQGRNGVRARGRPVSVRSSSPRKEKTLAFRGPVSPPPTSRKTSVIGGRFWSGESFLANVGRRGPSAAASVVQRLREGQARGTP